MPDTFLSVTTPPLKAIAALLLAGLFVVFIAPACGGESAGNGQIAPPTGGGLPAGFPMDFPIYPDATILQGDALEEFLIVQLQTEASFQDVVNFYEETLREGRWQVLSSNDVREQAIHAFRFTAPGLPSEGTMVISKTATGDETTAIAITLPGPIR